ncbi:MAG: transporter substrate-binding domain-containing protein [Nitrospirales bacterium]|nr:transporter substrate-binding domain-containing protein [Nitrospirales bacterium]
MGRGQWGTTGVLLALGGSIGVLGISIGWMNHVLRPRPKILDFPKPYFSKSPTIRWKYEELKHAIVTYEVLVKSHDPEITHPPIQVPKSMFYAEIRGIYGKMDVTVNALNNGKVFRTSRVLEVEIYRNAMQRIKRTETLRVAVHADPGVEFQFYPWPEVIGAPRRFAVDCAIASISISQYRAESEHIIFSEPYAESALGVVAAKSSFEHDGDTTIDLQSLQGKTVAFHKATTAAMFVDTVKEDSQYRDIRFHMAENNNELRELLRNNSVQAVLYDYHRAYALLEPGMFVQYLQHGLPMDPDCYGITFAMISTRLRERVNVILTMHRKELRDNLKKLVQNQISQSENE